MRYYISLLAIDAVAERLAERASLITSSGSACALLRTHIPRSSSSRPTL